MIVKDRIYIGGQLVEPSGSTTIDVVNPFTEEVAGRVPEATTADDDDIAIRPHPHPRYPAGD